MQLTHTFCLLLLPFLCLPHLAAQERDSDTHYTELLERARKGDVTVDFTDLRMSYAGTTFYAPDMEDHEVQLRMRSAMVAGEFETALAHADTLLGTNYLGMEAHYVCLVAHQELGDQARSDHHAWMVNRLLKSIMASGDGTTPQTAFVVVSVAEEYDMIQIHALQQEEQRMEEIGGIPYDIMTVVDPETNRKHIFYFDISRPMAHLQRGMNGAAPEAPGRK